MRRAVVYEISREKLIEFKTDATDVNIIFELFGIKTMLSYVEYGEHEKFFIHVRLDDDTPKDLFISHTKRFDHELVTMRNPIGITSEKTEITDKEEEEMIAKLVGFKIEEVTLKEDIKGIALKVAVESIINSGVLGDARIEKEDGKAYLVRGGDVEELTGEGFKEKAQKFLSGKTLEELEAISNNTKRKDHVMMKLIEGLDLIQEIKLKKESTGLLG